MTTKQPRVQPDGKVVLVNKGTTTDPDVHIVPTAKQIEEGTDLTDYVVEGSLQVNGTIWHTGQSNVSITSKEEIEEMKEFAAALGVAPEDIEGFVAQWAEAAERILQAPKQELLYRLNSQVRGIDPGLPQNWPGERGLR